MISCFVLVQRIPINLCPVPDTGAIVTVEARPIGIGEDAECLAILGIAVRGVGILHYPGDVMEPVVIPTDGHRVRVVSCH